MSSSVLSFLTDAIKENLEKKMKAYISLVAKKKQEKIIVFTDERNVKRWKNQDTRVVPHVEYPLVPIPETYNWKFMTHLYKEMAGFMTQYLDAHAEQPVYVALANLGDEDVPEINVLFRSSISTKSKTSDSKDSPKSIILLRIPVSIPGTNWYSAWSCWSQRLSGESSSGTPSTEKFTVLRRIGLIGLSERLLGPPSEESEELQLLDDDEQLALVSLSVVVQLVSEDSSEESTTDENDENLPTYVCRV